MKRIAVKNIGDCRSESSMQFPILQRSVHMTSPSVVRCLVSVPSADCLADLSALCRATWTSLLNPYSHVHDELVCHVGGGEAMGKLAASHLAILPIGSGASRGHTLELVATPETDRHVALNLLETILVAVLMPHVRALVPFDVSWATIRGYGSKSLEADRTTTLENA